MRSPPSTECSGAWASCWTRAILSARARSKGPTATTRGRSCPCGRSKTYRICSPSPTSGPRKSPGGVKNSLRSADTAARLGGDEFAILLEDGGEGIGAADVATRILASLKGPFLLENKEIFVRA